MANPAKITRLTSTDTTITVYYAAIPGADEYEIVYRVASDSVATVAGTTTELSYTIYGLEPETQYIVNYRRIVGDQYGDYLTDKEQGA